MSFLTCDGTRLTRNAILKWQEDWKIQWHVIVPGKPTSNDFVESFNGRMQSRLKSKLQINAP
ncbi:integrase core domain-containing protein [Roseovarius sp.]|uniref:integrase core domain-containing protein n=1 Tax=Rhodobacterales TaxID=204455 RepID=UPI0035672BBF